MTEDVRLNSLKVILLSQLLIESLDTIKGTNLYNGKVKQHGNTLRNLLNPMLNSEVAKIYKTDPTLTTNLFNEIDGLVSKIATCNVVDITMIHQIFDHYSTHKEDWQNFFSIEMEQLQD